ncbi:Winged helix DNA-binding domain-containing protein [Agrococcus jejuensis]|uniref:Winged helix DNA-binding domain-containing protein n=1 Tax=Agrococcus jejuensis TaxID=399736 RepID=A0A1G8EHE3_9MICO|nr:Winged helix DNA-binding domain-containing protein [Agrococcus jejuensis]
MAVARRVLAVRAWPGGVADLAVRMRSAASPDVAGAVADGDLVAVYAFGGGAYVAAHDVAAAFLAARQATGVWRSVRFQRQGGFAIDDWEPLREAVRDLLAAGPATRAELGAHLAGIPALAHLATAASTAAGADTLIKPLHWWGDVCFGPPRDGQSTFRLLAGDPRWPGPLDVDDAGRTLVRLVLGSYAPSTTANLEHWIREGLSVPARRLAGWVDDLGDEVVRVDGTLCLTTDADAIASATPSTAVHLLPGYDPWVMVPGTADASLVAEHRRPLATRGANLVLHGGVVAGTWRRTDRALAVTWFDEAGDVPDLDEAVARLGAVVGRELAVTLERDGRAVRPSG